MNVYITKLNGLSLRDKSQSIQRMTVEIAHQIGCREMGIFRYDGSSESRESFNGRIDGIIAGIGSGDIVVCQFPTGNGIKFEWELIKRLKVYQGRVVIFIQEAKSLVNEFNRKLLEETVKLYNQAEALIVPSAAIQKFLLDSGLKEDMKFIIQEMWDYITGINFFSFPQFRKEIHFACGDGFAGMNEWDNTISLKLYDVTVKQTNNVHNMGKLTSDELLSALAKGGFGLIWYQDENSKRSMEYDASFYLARYLTAGIPVIVPAGISNQILIEKNHLGLIVHSLAEAVTVIKSMTESDYREYVRCVKQFALLLRNGYYTKKCLVDAVQTVCRKDVVGFITPAEIYNLRNQAFTYAVVNESYEGNLALSWSYHGEASGFLIYDMSENLLYETRNLHQHYFLINGYESNDGFVIKAYIDTLKGKGIVAESEPIYFKMKNYDQTDVSLIIPAYNAQEYIVRCIDIALAQSLSGLEIVIVDDGSMDNTAKVVDWYAEKYSNVKAIHQENSGVGVARNTGIQHAKGEYIGFMDSDDMIHPDMITRLYHSAKKNNCDIAITSVYRIEENGYKVFIQYPMDEDTALSVDDFFEMHYKKELIFSVAVWNKLYRASLVKERLFPDFFLGEDGAWTPYILSFADRICYLNDCAYEYDRVIRKSTLEDQWMNKIKEERFMMYKDIITFYLENGNPDRRRFLKMLARTHLLGRSRLYGEDEYERLWEDIDKRY